MENPLNSVLIVGSGEDLLDDQFSCASDNGRIVSEVGVLKEQSVILLMDTSGVLDKADLAILGGELGIKVTDIPFAITA
jgi:hypothetical protein